MPGLNVTEDGKLVGNLCSAAVGDSFAAGTTDGPGMFDFTQVLAWSTSAPSHSTHPHAALRICTQPCSCLQSSKQPLNIAAGPKSHLMSQPCHPALRICHSHATSHIIGCVRDNVRERIRPTRSGILLPAFCTRALLLRKRARTPTYPKPARTPTYPSLRQP